MSVAFRVELASTAVRDMNKIPPRYLGAIIEFVYGPLAENPARVGGRLERDLEGLRSAHRGAYRVLYTILDDDQVVVVHRIDHRAHVYRHSD